MLSNGSRTTFKIHAVNLSSVLVVVTRPAMAPSLLPFKEGSPTCIIESYHFTPGGTEGGSYESHRIFRPRLRP